jgi:hypothetical protein
MMKDYEFKALKHCCNGYGIYSSGRAVEKGYSPDFVLSNKNEFIIIEHESEPNRKTIVADVFKAALFLQDDKSGILIIVLTPKGTSSFESYPKHVVNYFNWLKQRTNLREVYFIHPEHYYKEQIVLNIGESDFKQKSIALSSI